MKSTCLTALKHEDGEDQQLTEADQLAIEEEDHVTIEEDAGNAADDMMPLEHESEGRVDDNKALARFLMINHADICLYLCVSLLLISSLVALVVVLLQIVLPYKRAHTFLNATCVTASVNSSSGNTCMCGVGCTANYRCLKITVTFMDQSMHPRNASFYENESTLGKECSFYPPCRHSPRRAEDAVKEYEQQYATMGRTFPCLYSAPTHDRRTIVIRTRLLSVYHVLHGLLWSSFLFVASLVALVVIVHRKGCHLYADT